MLPLQLLSMMLMVRAIGEYMKYNEERIKVTNELIQGIRIVKYGGLEVFKWWSIYVFMFEIYV
jgi:hypothetical protein